MHLVYIHDTSAWFGRFVLSTLVRPFSIFHNGICVSEPREFIWSYKNKCIIFTLFVFIASRSVLFSNC